MREARIRAQLPQDRVGVLMGLDESTTSARISRYETGVHEPSLSTARAIAAVLNVPLAYLYCEDDIAAEILLELHLRNEDQLRRFLAWLREAE
ncbi:helix-turn-helix domain-containing protein [Pseudacidovorax sp. NFM-22]|uniref:helix-turn-helix domain-containing protein n=1 Tax=Pseudacidovorax sp. NFM-22 TaxID=2744469 RepID=UPI001F3BF8C5|nr:helix-turn-helix transcriptional regulator [Pseudacidovorax sp. NFM-22]